MHALEDSANKLVLPEAARVRVLDGERHVLLTTYLSRVSKTNYSLQWRPLLTVFDMHGSESRYGLG